MKNLRMMTTEETKKANGGGAIGFAVKLFFKIVLKPGKVY